MLSPTRNNKVNPALGLLRQDTGVTESLDLKSTPEQSPNGKVRLASIIEHSKNSRRSDVSTVSLRRAQSPDSALFNESFVDSECDDSMAEPTTFQKQSSCYMFSKTSITSIAKGLSHAEKEVEKDRYIQRYKNNMDEQLDAVGVNRKDTFIRRTHSLMRSNSTAKQMLREAEADQRYKSLKRNSRIIIQITKENAVVLPKLILHPETQWRACWDVLMLLLVCYYAMVTPINISFDDSPFDILELELVLNCFFIVDILLQFFTSYKHEKGPNAGRLETSHSVIIINYLRSWFIIDLVASFPLDIIMNAAGGGSGAGGTLNKLVRLVRSVKLMRILRMSRIWKRLLHRVKFNPSVVRLFKLFGCLLIEWHWLGCMYWAIANAEGFDEDNDDNAWTPGVELLDVSFGSQYLRAYFWAVMVTTGVGKDIMPVSDVQYLFTTCAIIVGVLMYAIIVGSVGTALQSIDSPDSQKRRRMDSVREYLRQRDVSPELSDKILNYYDYCMSRHITEHDENVLTEIHSALKEKLDLEVNQQLLTKVPRFKQLPDGLLLVLIHSLVSRIYLPNELVYLIGEKASEMFFVVRGDLESLNTYGTTQEFLTDGSFFGDQIFKSNARRMRTIRCITHCEVLILTKAALRKIMQFFPEFACMVQRWSGQNKFQSLHGWARVAYAIRSQRYMKCMGANITFMDMVYHLRSDEDNADNPGIMHQNTDVSQNADGRVCEMDYAQFHSKWADTLRTFDHLGDKLGKKPKQKRGLSTKVNKFFGSDDDSPRGSSRSSLSDVCPKQSVVSNAEP